MIHRVNQDFFTNISVRWVGSYSMFFTYHMCVWTNTITYIPTAIETGCILNARSFIKL